MKQYRLYRKDIQIYKDWITIIPTIDIHLNNMIYRDRNFAITFNWLVFHARLLWVEEQGENT